MSFRTGGVVGGWVECLGSGIWLGRGVVCAGCSLCLGTILVILSMRGRIQASKAMDKKSVKSKLKGQPPSLGSPAPVGSRQQLLTDGALDVCPMCCGCGVTVSDEVNALQCDLCESPDMWKCTDCLGIPPSLYSALFGCKELKWFCADCDKGCSKSKENSVGSKNAEMLDDNLE